MPIAVQEYQTRHNQTVFVWTCDFGREKEDEIEEEFPTLVGLPKLKISCKYKSVEMRIIDRKVTFCYQVQYIV